MKIVNVGFYLLNLISHLVHRLFFLYFESLSFVLTRMNPGGTSTQRIQLILVVVHFRDAVFGTWVQGSIGSGSE